MQTQSFDWPNEFLIIVVVLFIVAIAAPWTGVIRRMSIGRFLMAACATGAWSAYEFYLRSIAPSGDPLIRADLFLLIPLAGLSWFSPLLSFCLRRRG